MQTNVLETLCRSFRSWPCWYNAEQRQSLNQRHLISKRLLAKIWLSCDHLVPTYTHNIIKISNIRLHYYFDVSVQVFESESIEHFALLVLFMIVSLDVCVLFIFFIVSQFCAFSCTQVIRSVFWRLKRCVTGCRRWARWTKRLGFPVSGLARKSHLAYDVWFPSTTSSVKKANLHVRNLLVSFFVWVA